MTTRVLPRALRPAGPGRTAVALVSLAFTTAMIGTTLPTPLYPLYQRAFGFGELVTTVVFAVYAFGVMAALLLTGGWSDVLGRRPMLRAGLALSALSALVFVLAGSPLWLAVARMLSGLSAGVFTGTATATIIDVAPPEHRERASLVAAAANMGGLGLGPLLAGLLAQYAPAPLRLCYLVYLALVALAAVAVEAVADPVRRQPHPRLRPRNITVPPEARGVFTRAAIAGFAGFAVLGLFTAVSPAFLGSVLHDTNHALAGCVVLSAFAASTAGQVVSVKTTTTTHAQIAGCAGLIAGMALVAGALAARSLALLVAGAVLAGLGQGMSFHAGLDAITSAAPADTRAQTTSTFFLVLYVGITIPVIGEGAAATAFGLVPSGLAFAAGVALLAALALVLILLGARRVR